MSHLTKARILEAAIRLFNDNGVANVRLQHIAAEAGISVGNLAYHFKNKEAIVTAVYEQLFDSFSEILASYLLTPTLADFDEQIAKYYGFFFRHKFYLIDLFEAERSYPAILERWHQMVGKMLIQIRKRLDYYAQRKVLQAEPAPGIYDSLTQNIWMTIVFWLPQQTLKGQPATEEHLKEAVWALIVPYLTERGRGEFAGEVAPAGSWR